MNKNIPLFQVDAFTNQAFSGNPAAVCLLETPLDEMWMESVAAEMNLSETAFVQRGDNGFDLRWFTPTVEVDLCGHATLAAAHVLWQQKWLPHDEDAHFQTRSGLLIAKSHKGRIILDFPATPAKAGKEPSGLFSALGITSAPVFWNEMDYLVCLDDATAVRNLEPDFATLGKIKARGIIVTAVSDQDDYDFISRFFAPAAGINEDPVTGSAHCTLAPFWAERLQKDQMKAFQASSRGGEIGINLQGERVLLTGNATTVLAGELYV